MNVATNKKLTTFDLKIIGLLLMVLDHIHEMFYTITPSWLDLFGRPVATIFFFVSVEGFIHTRNQKAYMKRLLYGFWIMAIGNLIISMLFEDGNVALMNNIFCDIFVGVSTLYGINTLTNGVQTKKTKQIIIGLFFILAPIINALLISTFLKTMPLVGMLLNFIYPAFSTAENGIFCYLIVVLYFLRNSRLLQCVAIAITAIIYTGYTSNNWQFNDLLTANTQWVMILSIIPIWLYNGKPGKSMKNFFYIFYPAHIWIFYILASLLIK